MNIEKLELLTSAQKELLYQVLNDSILEFVRDFKLSNKITVEDIDNHVKDTLNIFDEYSVQQIVFEEIREEGTDDDYEDDDYDFEEELAEDFSKAIKCPGYKIRSKDIGRGLGIGKGRGPIRNRK